MSTLVIADHDQQNLLPATFNTVGAARELGQPIDLLVAGHHAEKVARAAAAMTGVKEILHADGDVFAHLLPENTARQIVQLAPAYTHIFASATANAKAFMPYAAGLCGVKQVSGAKSVLDAETFVRPIYAGAVMATVRSRAATKFVTIQPGAFAAVPMTGGDAAIRMIAAIENTSRSRFVSMEKVKSDRPDLDKARIIVAGGRGLNSDTGFRDFIFPLADKLGAGVAASRAAVDSGWAPYDWQVGQTGKTVAPDIYFAVGISGAIQHLAGMKDSKIIVAINKDNQAPIIEIADYSLIGNIADIMPKLVEAVRPGKDREAAASLSAVP